MQNPEIQTENTSNSVFFQVEWCTGDKSKRSNVFEVSSNILGMTILLQDDSLALAAEWYQDIREVIESLNTASKKNSTASACSGELESDFDSLSTVDLRRNTLQKPPNKTGKN